MNNSVVKSNFLNFLDKSPSPFHAVRECIEILKGKGFIRLSEQTIIKPNGKYFVTRNGSSIIAFAVGGAFAPSRGAFNIIATHTDSPCLRVKPLSKKKFKEDFSQVGVECYGGGLWHTWFDRDLSVAGRVIFKSNTEKAKLVEKLVNIERPILRIPTLAIHLDPSVSQGFSFNKELHLCPILSTSQIEMEHRNEEYDSMHSCLMKELLKNSNSKLEPSDIISSDLCLYDTQKSSITGVANEFVQSSRLDNLFMTFCGLESLIESDNLDNDNNVRVLVCFDNEEVGSLSNCGAESNIIKNCMERIIISFDGSLKNMNSLLSKSFLISADMAHACHPNYPDKHEDLHRPKMHKGVVIKYNSNQRYTTNSRSAAKIKIMANENNIPIQEFCVRNDSSCGSTIGPIVASQLGIESIDVGAPQLSMHSIREMASIEDMLNSVNLFKTFYSRYSSSIDSLDDF